MSKPAYNFATWSIRNPIPTILLFVLLSIAGIKSFQELPIAELPDVRLPTILVTLSQPGAAPAQLETEVARKAEDALATLSSLRHIQTSISDGVVSIRVEFMLKKSLSDALIESRNALDRIRSDLPDDVLEPSVSAETVDADTLLTYAISAPRMNEEALSWYVDNTISKRVLSVPGLGRFERVGGVQREVHIELDPTKLAGLNVTASDVSQALRITLIESSGGRMQLGNAAQSVRTITTAKQADELNAFPLVLTDGRTLRLDQVATVQDTTAERSQIALLNGKDVVGFQVYRATGFDETKIAAGIKQVLEDLKVKDGVDFTLVYDKVSGTQEQYKGSINMLFEGAFLAILIVWWFLRDWRSTLIAATALPLSILPTFAAMYFLDYSLNTLTLLALAVIVGILVDDAIVEIENIERHVRMGKGIKKAAGDAVTEIALAVMATTMTLVMVFAPTAMMSGITGLFFKQFGWTAVVAVLSSLLVARLLTPMMAAYMLKPKTHITEKKQGKLLVLYLSIVQWTLNNRFKTLMATLIVFAVTASLVPLLNTGLMPASNSNYTTVSIELPPGSAFNTTLAKAEETRKTLLDIAGIDHIFSTIGVASGENADSAGGDVRKSQLILILKERSSRATQSDIEKVLRDVLVTVPGARFSVGGGIGQELSFILASDDSTALKASANNVLTELRGIDGISNIQSTASLERPEIIVRPNLQRASELGVSTSAIGDTIRVATSGDHNSQLAKLNLDTRQIYIRVLLEDSHRLNIETLRSLRVPARNGQLIPLSSVASISFESGPSQIDRYDRKRFITISAKLNGRALGDIINEAHQLPSMIALPSNVELIEAGDAELMNELSSGFSTAILTGLLCVLCVLILLFKDLIQPITILSAIPLSLSGAFVALLLTGSELDIPSMIGLIMLLGIVTKNSILLVEYAVMSMKKHGLNMHDALLNACNKRARPIIMTTAAMIAGMLPIAMGLGADASFRQPMAIAVIGGLITSTLLSLIVVPVVFTYMHGLGQKCTALFKGRTSIDNKNNGKTKTESL
ncbi:efflux RND transporter permease subunit [Marinomonas foliarum]|jgi:hydrophobe/amphiphile efflux-1 (HAE1) family protein|uniref:Hydrophobe/amphiphile efflux-1 (HAE1) family protein n=1 Tax=Marinomonas foliarum TaxID=491950 RepID=A0A368ZVY3_9GAMM|nr:efflux RND transporter permease subunit [Marinomonas foliarum]RCX01172.1 hydrophobe/amphiphile efflux-1 (HAE1) family protein [Marinomonas foliarum]